MEKKNKVFKFTRVLLLIFKETPKYAILLSIFRLVSALLPIIRLFLINKIIEDIQRMINNSVNLISYSMPIILLILLELINGILLACTQSITRKSNIYLKLNTYPKLLEKITKLEIFCFENRATMDLITRVKNNYVNRIVSTLTTTLYLTESILVALSIIFVLINQVGLSGLSILIVSIPLLIAGQKSGKELYQGEIKLQNIERYISYIENLFVNREAGNERILFKFTNQLNKIWEKKIKEADLVNNKVKIKAYIRMFISSLLTFLGYAIVIGILCIFFIKSKLSVGMLISTIIIILRLMYTLSYSLSWDIAEMGRSLAFANDYDQFLKLSEVEDVIDAPIHDFTFEELEFDNVSFKYPNAETPIIQNLSFKIQKGKKYAFVGENGAGKSTIIKLILGFYQPYEGIIRINNRPLTEFSFGELKALFSVVFQDYAKYELAISENLSLGNSKASKSEIMDILKFVKLDNIINGDIDKLDQMVGKLTENSIELSRGQWQRMAIARAMISNRPIFILDEATASIDPIQEKEIYNLFENTLMNSTTIFISHRLGSTKFVDCIYVLHNGKIIEKGNHNDLMQLKGFYAQMYDTQQRWYK